MALVVIKLSTVFGGQSQGLPQWDNKIACRNDEDGQAESELNELQPALINSGHSHLLPGISF